MAKSHIAQRDIAEGRRYLIYVVIGHLHKQNILMDGDKSGVTLNDIIDELRESHDSELANIPKRTLRQYLDRLVTIGLVSKQTTKKVYKGQELDENKYKQSKDSQAMIKYAYYKMRMNVDNADTAAYAQVESAYAKHKKKKKKKVDKKRIN